MKLGVPRVCAMFAILAMLCVGCVSAPVQEMSNARQAISAAVEAGAEDHAPDDLAAARALLDNAESSLHNKEFRQARRAAVAAKEKAVAALEATQN